MLIFSSWVWFICSTIQSACNIQHVNYILQFVYYSTTYNIWTSNKYSIINNNTKFKDQLVVESGKTILHTPVGTTACCLMAISRTKSDHVLHFNSRRAVSLSIPMNSHSVASYVSVAFIRAWNTPPSGVGSGY